MIHLDELTGLLTKRSLFRALDAELLRTERFRHPLSVLMMDLDHFRLINDAYGHMVGSRCLSEVGALIRETVRVSDVSGRYGGEEFVSFLPETDTAAALIDRRAGQRGVRGADVRARRDDLSGANLGRHRDVPGRRRECGRARSISRDGALPRQGARSESLRGCGSQGLKGSRRGRVALPRELRSRNLSRRRRRLPPRPHPKQRARHDARDGRQVRDRAASPTPTAWPSGSRCRGTAAGTPGR